MKTALVILYFIILFLIFLHASGILKFSLYITDYKALDKAEIDLLGLSFGTGEIRNFSYSGPNPDNAFHVLFLIGPFEFLFSLWTS